MKRSFAEIAKSETPRTSKKLKVAKSPKRSNVPTPQKAPQEVISMADIPNQTPQLGTPISQAKNENPVDVTFCPAES